MKNAPVLVKGKKKASTTTAHASFLRLRRKIESLNSKIKAAGQRYENALQLYHSDLVPKQRELSEAMIQFFLKIRDIVPQKNVLTKKEWKALQEVLESDINLLLNITTANELPKEISEFYQFICGENIKERFDREINSIKALFREEGFEDDIDLSGCSVEDSIEELMAKIGGAIHRAKEENEDFVSLDQINRSKPKTKHELLKEKKAQDLQELQNKGIGNIYKRLAKEFHPDLEQDPAKQQEKVLLMKRLTSAYEKRDMVELLTLESEWFGRMEGEGEKIPDDTLKIYNSLLKDQVKDLEMQLASTKFNPRYLEIMRYVQEDLDNPADGIIDKIDETHSLIRAIQNRMKDISGDQPLKALKKEIAKMIEITEEGEFFKDLFNLNFVDDDDVEEEDDDVLLDFEAMFEEFQAFFASPKKRSTKSKKR